MAGEVTTLEHELGDDTVETRASVALTLGLVAQLTEVRGRLGNNRVEQLEVDTSDLACSPLSAYYVSFSFTPPCAKDGCLAPPSSKQQQGGKQERNSPEYSTSKKAVVSEAWLVILAVD